MSKPLFIFIRRQSRQSPDFPWVPKLQSTCGINECVLTPDILSNNCLLFLTCLSNYVDENNVTVTDRNQIKSKQPPKNPPKYKKGFPLKVLVEFENGLEPREIKYSRKTLANLNIFSSVCSGNVITLSMIEICII